MTNENHIKVKFKSESFVSNIIKFLTLAQPNKVLPVEDELHYIDEKINNSKTLFTDDDCSTVGLSSNPSSFSSNESAEEYFSTNKYSFTPNKFNMQFVLGSGTFGRVFLAEYEDGNQYALKCIQKSKISKEELEQIMNEKDILKQLSSPFVLRLYGTCQTKNELYFVTEFISCGNLYNAIYNGVRLTHEMCVFYGTSIILGLDFIHSKNIVYRDIKPENIMIRSNGYPCIVDFGLSKQLPYTKILENNEIRTYSKCYTLCGTPEYVAPELILNSGYDEAVDIWAFGVLLYEMIFRRTPFIDDKNEDDITQIFINVITASKNGIVLSIKTDKRTDGTPNARNLMTQIFTGKKEERRGPNNKTADLLKHPYFLSMSMTMDIDAIRNHTFIPSLIQDEFLGEDIDTAKPIKEYDDEQERFADF